jgi:hypothetical protein
MRRKRQRPQSEVELAVISCVPEESAPEPHEPLPQYRAGVENQPPPPDYQAVSETIRVDEGHPPEYSRPAAR